MQVMDNNLVYYRAWAKQLSILGRVKELWLKVQATSRNVREEALNSRTVVCAGGLECMSWVSLLIGWVEVSVHTARFCLARRSTC